MRTWLITGTSSGIGQAITQQLLQQGDHVIGIARRHPPYAPHPAYTHYAVDLAQTADLEPQFKAIQAQHPEIDGFICNAGYGQFAELEQFSVQDIERLFAVNVISPILLSKVFLPKMKQRKTGKIIFIGSECALNGNKKSSIYSANKFAIRGFCQSLRKECAHRNITVTLINPGLVRSDFFADLTFEPGQESQQAILPKQIADAVQFVINSANNCVVTEINLEPLQSAVNKKTVSSVMAD